MFTPKIATTDQKYLNVKCFPLQSFQLLKKSQRSLK